MKPSRNKDTFAGGGQNVTWILGSPLSSVLGPSQKTEGHLWETNFPPSPHPTQSKWGNLKECSQSDKANIFSINSEKCLYTKSWDFSLRPQARKLRPPVSLCLMSLSHSICLCLGSQETWHFPFPLGFTALKWLWCCFWGSVTELTMLQKQHIYNSANCKLFSS